MPPTSNAQLAGGAVFHAIITPSLSLGRRGFLVLMAVVAAISFGTGILFANIGAWPVTGFMGLDAVALWAAFRIVQRRARAFEEVLLTQEELLVRDVAASGAAREHRFNPYWVRIEAATHRLADEGLESVRLVSHGHALPIASALSPLERRDFARALENGIRQVKARTA